MKNKIEKILVLVELENGKVHQVLTSKKRKEMSLQIMKSEKHGSLMLSEEVEPIKLEFKNNE